MKYALAIGFGFWLGRRFYLSLSESEAIRREQQLIRKLTDFFKDQGFSNQEIKEEVTEIMKTRK